MEMQKRRGATFGRGKKNRKKRAVQGGAFKK